MIRQFVQQFVRTTPSSLTSFRALQSLDTSTSLFNFRPNSLVNQAAIPSTSVNLSALNNTQLRGKKKLKKHRPGIDERIPEPSEMKHSILSDPYFFSGKARPRRTLPPRYTDIILRKDCKYGMKGEIFKVKTPHAYTIIGKKVAAKKTPLTLKKYSSHITPELEQEMTQKRLERNLRFIIEHAAVQFKRKIAGPKREYYWPITRKDIVNRVWNVYKIPLKEEQIIMKQNYPDRPISKPGYQLIYVKLDDGKPPAMLRVYLKRGGNTYQGF